MQLHTLDPDKVSTLKHILVNDPKVLGIDPVCETMLAKFVELGLLPLFSCDGHTLGDTGYITFDGSSFPIDKLPEIMTTFAKQNIGLAFDGLNSFLTSHVRLGYITADYFDDGDSNLSQQSIFTVSIYWIVLDDKRTDRYAKEALNTLYQCLIK